MKIIGENTDQYAQGYFVYDSKKAGSVTVSHLRFSPRPIHSSYLIDRANFIACHQFNFVDRIDMLSVAEPQATFLLNSAHGPDEVWDHLPRDVQEQIIEKQLKVYVVNALEVARAAGMGSRINTIMQTCFFALSGVLPREEAIGHIKQAIEKTYGKRGQTIIDRNFAAVDQALEGLHQVTVPAEATSETAATHDRQPGRRLRGARDFYADGRPGRHAAGKCAARSMAHSRRAQLSTRNEALRPKYRFGIPISASSAACAPWCARMRPFAPRPIPRMPARTVPLDTSRSLGPGKTTPTTR